MLALIGAGLAGLAGILHLVGKHQDWILWLLIIGLLLVCIQVAFAVTPLPWRRGK